MIIQRFNLNLIPNQSPVIVHVNQYDTGAGRLVATLYEGNEPYSPNGTAVIQGTKPDGHGFQYTVTLDGNVVTADLTEQMAPVAGDVRTQIVVTESSGVTGTFAFIMRVQPSALPSDTDMSESDYQYIEEAIREAQEAVQTAQEATETAQEAVQRAEAAITETQENAEDSEAWAQGTRGGIPVDPTDPTYEHNAEYWAQYAERYAQGGLHYKGSIPFADIPTTGMREGDMYNITDDFTTDSRFEEGAGIEVKGGTNIAWNSDDKWDVLALPPKTTFNGRSGSILPMAGDYDSRKILLSSALHIGGETQSDVQEALEALSNDGVKSFNGRSGSVLPMAGDYDSEKILLSSILHIGGETQDNVQEALEALEGNKADRVDNAVEDNFAGLDADGNLKDSGKKASDFATPSDIAGQQSLLKDTVGFTGKNLLPNKVWAFSLSSGSVGAATYQANANATGFCCKVEKNKDYIISRKSSTDANKRFTVVLSENEPVTGGACQVVFATPAETEYSFNSGNNEYVFLYCGLSLTDTDIRPMLRHADITDPTYEPYHESVEEEIEQIYTDNGVLGAKNLLPNNAKSQTIYGITYTVNSDGSVTANGTKDNTDNGLVILNRNTDNYSLPSGNYILSGNPGENSILLLQATRNGSLVELARITDTTEEKIARIESTDILQCVLIVARGITVSNLVFKPMIRLASDPDDTYQPHAMTNRELTENLFYKNKELTSSDNLDDITTTGLYYIYDSVPTNSPESTNYCTVIVNQIKGITQQTVIKSTASAGSIYVRTKSGSPLAWKPWMKFTGTVVS